MMSDIEIAQNATMQPIEEIAAKLGIEEDALEHYGKYKAKIDYNKIDQLEQNGKLILVSAMTPTPAGEGKTTTSVGLGDGLTHIGKKAAVALREPSLGPVFGIKGGAAGGGYAQVVPMEDINLHFTGDLHAIGAANNLVAAMLDNHIYQGNELNIDPRRVAWKRAVDMNDRQLRQIVDGIGKRTNGVPREDGFEITVASEIMAVLCLSNTLTELKEKVKKCVVAYTYDYEPVTIGGIKAQGAVTALLKDALKPNLVQTLEGTPAFIHGGPFANIAHGCSSIMATKMALAHADYVITEAGFGADLGGEKFVNIKSRYANLNPDATVIVATVRALKMHGGVAKADLEKENVEALREGMPNLIKHIENIQDVFGMNAVVAINAFPTDTEAEMQALKEEVEKLGVDVVRSTHFADGGEGAAELAKKVAEIAEKPNNFQFTYDLEDSAEEKLNKIVQRVYGGANVEITRKAARKLQRFEEQGYGNLPICMAKTQYSFSEDKKRIGRPEGFTITVRDVSVSAGAGFIVVLTGDVMRMPGLPSTPSAEKIDVDENGNITGLF
ncbi:formate--tetrahydrofolate ligase [Dolosigranulum pigrum]|uniref:formate--tetrahydrofolate ligase n=1 Tax=Dolosigranulum pigrum TaxID=29394 RepID=UPI001AD86220|nr:formate--tetrahydrofolate ligase [Dolosigranulum pigrum]QTJ42457.1 formate--tetrahydrofolate ligase [Dolosigranulum pigrum]QTJ45850.1 formate--tetrahydrofolate ligase [Dolosigranulum pigrum]QTJ59367.1 formate--tetrahydrofolate ligase [Dolosigranulum pigrum]